MKKKRAIVSTQECIERLMRVGQGIRIEGPVLAGEKSPEERRDADAARAVRPDEEFYGSAEEYDAVLRAHRRL